MWHAWKREEKCTVLVESLKERAHLEDRDVDRRIGLEWILGRSAGGGGGWSGFTLLRIGTPGGLF
jgi:hypothetical protein